MSGPVGFMGHLDYWLRLFAPGHSSVKFFISQIMPKLFNDAMGFFHASCLVPACKTSCCP